MKRYLLCLVCLSLLYGQKLFLCVCMVICVCVCVCAQLSVLPWLSIYILYFHISSTKYWSNWSSYFRCLNQKTSKLCYKIFSLKWTQVYERHLGHDIVCNPLYIKPIAESLIRHCHSLPQPTVLHQILFFFFFCDVVNSTPTLWCTFQPATTTSTAAQICPHAHIQ